MGNITLTFLMLICTFHHVFAQFHANHWFFGNFNSINFTQGYPSHSLNNSMKAKEGCASFSDSLGNLLFYTNGKELWKKNHVLISSNLSGDPDATQSSIFVPSPSNPDTLYLFVTGAFGLGNFQYYRLSGTQQNIIDGPFPLWSPTCEKMTAVQHSNGKDFWILTHEWNSNRFVAFLLNSNGIQPPMISSIGTVHAGQSLASSGTMKFSPNAKKVAVAIPYLNLVEQFDFDEHTGMVTNPKQVSIRNPYGVSFSPNSQLLYITGYYFAQGGAKVCEVFQWSNQSLNVVGSWTSPLFTPEITIGDISNAPDGKIYICRQDASNLSVIQKPNLIGSACQFVTIGMETPNRQVTLGLPNFVQNFLLKPKLDFSLPISACAEDTLSFCVQTSINQNFTWKIENKTINSSQNCLSYAFTTPGIYSITLENMGYSVTKMITILPKPKNPFPSGYVYACRGEAVMLDAQNPGASYFWSNGYSSPYLIVTNSGLFNVRIFYGNGQCSATYPVSVQFSDTPKVSLPDTFVCGSNFVSYQNPFVDAQTFWNGDSVPSHQFVISQSGTYKVKITRFACEWLDTFEVTISPPYQKFLPTDTSFCPTFETLELKSGDFVSYLWSNGDTTRSITVQEAGFYQLVVTDKNGCVFHDSVHVNAECNLVFMPNAFTPDNNGLNDILEPKSPYLQDYVMKIFNQSGNLIYTGKQWNAENAPEGVYVVLLNGVFLDGKTFENVYNVTLIR